MVALHDAIRVKNVAPPDHKYSKLEFFHGPGQRWVLNPTEEAVVPYYIAKNWFGDVRSGGTVTTQPAQTDIGTQTSVIPTREFEVARLHTHYGLHSGPTNTFDKDSVPNVELYDMDGNRVPSVLEDPEGKNVVEATQTVSQYEAMQRQIEQLTSMVNQLQGSSGPPATVPFNAQKVTVPDEREDDSTGYNTVANIPTDDVEGV